MKKGPNPALIVIICVVVLGIIIVGVLLLANIPAGTGQDETGLAGTWDQGRGGYIYYFIEAEEIRFTSTGATTGRVHDDYGEWGDWYVDDDGTLCIDGEDSGYYEFTFSINLNILTITDEDGDSRRFSRKR